MHQEDLMERVLDALASMSARVLVLTGDEFDPAELPPRRDVRVERYIPHESVFPHARLVLSHGGMGTLLECLRAGVPSVCIPLGRDQHDNAHAASSLNATIAIKAGATTAELAAAIDEALHSPTIHAGVLAMAQTLADYGGAATAADEIEQLCDQSAAALW